MRSGVVPERPKQQTLRQLDVRESDYIQAVESGPSYITRALQSWGIWKDNNVIVDASFIEADVASKY